VKCVTFVGEDGFNILSGSSDNTLRLWVSDPSLVRPAGTHAGVHTASGGDTNRSHSVQDVSQRDLCLATLTGHSSRIWDVCSRRDGSLVASASADRTIRIWDLVHALSDPGSRPDVPRLSLASSFMPAAVPPSGSDDRILHSRQTIRGHDGDVYAVRFHPSGAHVVSGSYDRAVRVSDVETGKILRKMEGHHSTVASVAFNRYGNLIISGSKDHTVRFWDMLSGVCVKTVSGQGHVLCAAVVKQCHDSSTFTLRDAMSILCSSHLTLVR